MRYSVRILDVMISLGILLIISPFLVCALTLVFLQDMKSPIYAPVRVGVNKRHFRMYKVRTMVPGADANKVDSTSENDKRITMIGHYIRKIKIDEFAQFVNVLKGDMSIVGPRPNIERETKNYTKCEERLLSIKPGITDFSSIIFSDLNKILKDSKDPNLDYNQLVRPWKSRFGMIYVQQYSLELYFQLIFLTALNMVNRKLTLKLICKLLKSKNASDVLQQVALRNKPLRPTAPLGADEIVKKRNG